MKIPFILIVITLGFNLVKGQTIQNILEDRIVVSNQDTHVVNNIGHAICPSSPKNIDTWENGSYIILAGKNWKSLVSSFQIGNGGYCGEMICYYRVKEKYRLIFIKKYYLLEISHIEYYQNCDELKNGQKAKLLKVEGEKQVRVVLKKLNKT